MKNTNTKKRNSNQRGAEIERKVMHFLQEREYSVHHSKRSVFRTGPIIRCNSNDVFGCIDLVAVKPGEKTRFIQVTTTSGIGEKLKKILKIKWNLKHSNVEVWRYASKGRFILMQLKNKRLKKFAEIQRNQLLLLKGGQCHDIELKIGLQKRR